MIRFAGLAVRCGKTSIGAGDVSFEGNTDHTPERTAPVALMVSLSTRGGEEIAKQQLHRARAYFSTWIAKYPEYFDNFDKIIWGHY